MPPTDPSSVCVSSLVLLPAHSGLVGWFLPRWVCLCVRQANIPQTDPQKQGRDGGRGRRRRLSSTQPSLPTPFPPHLPCLTHPTPTPFPPSLPSLPTLPAFPTTSLHTPSLLPTCPAWQAFLAQDFLHILCFGSGVLPAFCCLAPCAATTLAYLALLHLHSHVYGGALLVLCLDEMDGMIGHTLADIHDIFPTHYTFLPKTLAFLFYYCAWWHVCMCDVAPSPHTFTLCFFFWFTATTELQFLRAVGALLGYHGCYQDSSGVSYMVSLPSSAVHALLLCTAAPFISCGTTHPLLPTTYPTFPFPISGFVLVGLFSISFTYTCTPSYYYILHFCFHTPFCIWLVGQGRFTFPPLPTTSTGFARLPPHTHARTSPTHTTLPTPTHHTLPPYLAFLRLLRWFTPLPLCVLRRCAVLYLPATTTTVFGSAAFYLPSCLWEGRTFFARSA